MFMRRRLNGYTFARVINTISLTGGRSEEPGTEIDKRIMAELKRKRNL